MESPWSLVEASRRLGRIRALPSGHYKSIIVASPHRFSVGMLKLLKSRSQRLIALLGDEPVGVRSVKEECWATFDKILVADESWIGSIPATDGTVAVMPWGSTLVDEQMLNAPTYKPESLVLVGSPYPERVSLARMLADKATVTLQGSGWPTIEGTTVRGSSSRLVTLESIRKNRELVINIHHKQFRRGLNPQFFDYAAAGIPQVVVHADQLDRYRLGMSEGSLAAESLLASTAVQGANEEIIARVRKSQMFSSCIRSHIK